MMGCTSGEQNEPFYDIRLEDYVPRGHLLRAIDHHLDVSELRHDRPKRLNSSPLCSAKRSSATIQHNHHISRRLRFFLAAWLLSFGKQDREASCPVSHLVDTCFKP